MIFQVEVSEEARQDLFAIHRYLAVEAGLDEANAFAARLADSGESLAEFPDRGTPVDLLLGGVRIRSIMVAPYRIFYEVADGTVIIFAVLHMRRDMVGLLEERRAR